MFLLKAHLNDEHLIFVITVCDSLLHKYFKSFCNHPQIQTPSTAYIFIFAPRNMHHNSFWHSMSAAFQIQVKRIISWLGCKFVFVRQSCSSSEVHYGLEFTFPDYIYRAQGKYTFRA